jgi:membrane protein implicated in regulation of membrane protease activity
METGWVVTWAIVIAVAIVLEIETFALVTSWFAVGGLAALVLALCGVDWQIQVIVFVLTSLAFLFALRPFLKKFMKSPTTPTNADLNYGKRFKLLADVVHGRSTININDVVWTVQVDGDFKAGDFVILRDVSGNKYIAEGVKEEDKK